MNIAIYGTGYVGLVTAVCFAKIGHHVIGVDIDTARIERLNAGDCPIYEEGLQRCLNKQLNANRLCFTSDLQSAVRQASIHFIATGTPSLPDGTADLSQVYAVVNDIITHAEGSCTLVVKSTVPVGTGDRLEQYIQQTLVQADKSITINVASNPEFLREGTALNDFINADRIIVGGNKKTVAALEHVYAPLIANNIPFLAMDRRSAELTKYAANAMLASRISFVNEISRIAEKTDANIEDITRGMGLDHRIGPHFLRAGIGYGGSCFPKDLQALGQIAKEIGLDLPLLSAIQTVNRQQKTWVIKQLNQQFNHDLANRRIGLWGLAFKPGTDDLREASSLVVVDKLTQAGAELNVYDPVALESARNRLAGQTNITWCDRAQKVLEMTLDALVIVTEWAEFIDYPLRQLAEHLGEAPLIDGRNCYSLDKVEAAKFGCYISVGRPVIRHSVSGRNDAD